MSCRWSILAVLVFGLSGAWAEEAPPAQPARLLQGCWQCEKDQKFVLLVEEKKCFLSQAGELTICRLKAEADRLSLGVMGQRLICPYRIEDGVLHLELGGNGLTFHKLEQEPAAIRPQPLKLGEPKPLPPEKLKEVQEELATRMTMDQAVRVGGARTDQTATEMQQVDRENTKYLKDLVAEIGWVDATRFGKGPSGNAFLLVQHSGDLPLMMAALPEIEKDVKAGRGDSQDFALLFDRLQLMTGERQRFGTQLGSNERGECVVLPMEDKDGVEGRRKAIGLFPFSEYLTYFKNQNGGKEISFMEE